MSTRAGRYISQSTGYKAFVPVPLPPAEPAFEMSPAMQVLLSKADRELGRLDGSVCTLPDPDWFIAMYVRKEAVLSSQIEGTQSSLHDLLAAEGGIADRGVPSDVSEVINYIAALNQGLVRLSEIPVSARLIREIHARLLEGARGGNLTPGAFRKTPVWIGAEGCTLNDASFVPPPPEEIAKAMSDLEQFIQPGASELPLLVVIGLAHAQFETIHPFLDGNGRLGRLLITFLLTERDVLSLPVLYLSYYFKRHRQRYYDLLQAVRDEGDWEGWITFFLKGVAEVAAEAAQTARAILQLREAHRGKIMEELKKGASNGNKLLESLYHRPIISVRRVEEVTGISYGAANNLVKKFVDMGILEEATGNSRNRVFCYKGYLDLFSGT